MTAAGNGFGNKVSQLRGRRVMNFIIEEQRISHSRFDDEVIVVNLASGAYFSLHGTAAEIWTLMTEGPVSAESLAAAFGTPHTEDIARFLEELAAQQLVTSAEGPARLLHT